MNYEENNINWQIGELVIHDADKKVEHMLMKVIGINITEKETIYKTRYLFANNLCNQRMIWSNDKKFLHDPKRFDINPKNQKEGE